MRQALIRGRSLALDAIARVLWRGALPLAMRSAAIEAVMRRTPGAGSVSRQWDLLAEAIADKGLEALTRQPTTTIEVLRRLQARGAAPVLIMGDSHSRLYVQRSCRGERWLLPLRHLATGGSARGLAKARSRSGQGVRIAEVVRSAAQAGLRAPVLLVFGQVDVEFVFTFKRLQQIPPARLDDDEFAAFCEATVKDYAAYAAGLAREGLPVAVAAILPPALSDAAWREGYLNAHIADEHAELDLDSLRDRLAQAEIASMSERTAQHRSFNARLARAAEGGGLQVIDVAAALPTAGGSVSPELVGRGGGRDHHLDARAIRPYVTAGLWDLLRREGMAHG